MYLKYNSLQEKKGITNLEILLRFIFFKKKCQPYSTLKPNVMFKEKSMYVYI